MQRVSFYDKQKPYKYMPLGDGRADVFIRKFIEEREELNEEDSTKTILFIYDENQFRVNMEEITEEMIKENPLSWLDYNPNIPDISLQERIEAIEEAILELGEVMYND